MQGKKPDPITGASLVRIDGVEVELLRLGQGQPLLYLHGMDGLEGSLDMVGRLAEHFEVFAPSHPGFGISELPARFSTVEDLAYFYLDLVETLGLRAPAVAGLSFGGWIAASMAIKNPQVASRLVLGAPLGLKATDRRRQDIADLFMLPAAAAEQIQQVTPLATKPLAQMEAGELYRLFRNREAVSLFGWSPYLHDPKLRQRLHRIQAPTLVLWGRDDALLPPQYGDAFAQEIPGAQCEILDRCGHRIHIDKPNELAERIAAFAATSHLREDRHARLAV
ncbi:MAG TPA: alpha/beta hydrolase [Xanthobacteraceae bacterium]|nr:alpha/beta hydrolase [Xanthobacteraceae bacterium]